MTNSLRYIEYIVIALLNFILQFAINDKASIGKHAARANEMALPHVAISVCAHEWCCGPG